MLWCCCIRMFSTSVDLWGKKARARKKKKKAKKRKRCSPADAWIIRACSWPVFERVGRGVWTTRACCCWSVFEKVGGWVFESYERVLGLCLRGWVEGRVEPHKHVLGLCSRGWVLGGGFEPHERVVGLSLKGWGREGVCLFSSYFSLVCSGFCTSILQVQVQ